MQEYMLDIILRVFIAYSITLDWCKHLEISDSANHWHHIQSDLSFVFQIVLCNLLTNKSRNTLLEIASSPA
jgi:hypothetical protein